MREGLKLAAIVVAVSASVLGAQTTIDVLNGVEYTWPAAQGSADQILTNDGSGTLSWSDPPSAEGLWSGVIIPSTVDCPASGWTRVSAADGRLLRGHTSTGVTGGDATHTHTITGILGSSGVSITGSTASSGVSIAGSTAVTSVSHTHGATKPTTSWGGTPPTSGALATVTIHAADPSHSHGAGTLSGSAHTHGVGTLAGVGHGHGVGTYVTSAESSLGAYLDVVLCQRD